MDKSSAFTESIKAGYNVTQNYILLGAALLDGIPQSEAQIKIPLKTLNRHGLIAGATGTGKTVTLQIIAENMLANGIPVLLMDLKGDLSGIARAGSSNVKVEERHKAIGVPYFPMGNTVELLSLSKEQGSKLRATVSEFGPVLFSKIVDLNDTQASVVAVVFKYADDKKLPLLDLKDFKRLLQYATEEGKEEFKKNYGNITTATTSTILRKVIELESQGADQFFGERSFDVNDLIRCDSQGKGIASIVRLTDIQDKPKLFSTFMLCLLAEIYATLPEAGDLEKPKLCVFIDEAHLIFNEASNALRNQIESIIKLIRSKGVGIFFCTQNPYDIPDAVLGQLGLKVQHALRAFTEKDRKNIKKTSENYPISEFYKTDELITSLGIGQALITALNEKGIPTPLAAVHLRAPMSRMGTLSSEEIQQVVNASTLISKYNEVLDRESAFEILTKKIESLAIEEEDAPTFLKKKEKAEPSTLEKLSKNPIAKQVGKTVARELTRGLLGILGIGGSGRRKKNSFW